MSNPANGGPAFPNEASPENPNFPGHRDVYASEGMSLRDYFAAKALVMPIVNDCQGGNWAALIAKGAYQIADAMLAERAK